MAGTGTGQGLAPAAGRGKGRPLPRPGRKARPLVLLILQGAHHLELYRAILAQCRAVDWICLIHGIEAIPRERLLDCHATHGTRFFSDMQTAIQHFGDIDAVVTTFAIPHPAHLPYLPMVALAYELGLPVFELQHGLFQIGFSYDLTSPIIGPRAQGALSGLPVRNLVAEQLRWWGPGAIGYPPYCAGVLDESAGPPDERRDGPVAILTNFHWDLLGPEETAAAYDLVARAILRLPEVPFVLAPHPSETAGLLFRRLTERLARAGAGNWRVLPASDSAGRRALLRDCTLAVSSASTVLLDLEMGDVPTAVFGLDCMEGLYDLFESCVRLRNAEALVDCIRHRVEDGWRPTLRTGCLVRFAPRRLEERLIGAMSGTPLAHDRFVPLINRYLQKV